MRNKKEFTPKQKLRRAEYAREWRKKNPKRVAEHAKRSRIKNKEKVKVRQREWGEKNKEHRSKKGKEWYLKNKNRVRNTQLKRYFGITLKKYDELLNKQNNGCAICDGPPGKRSFSVDHDHITGKVRGLLCRGCNVGIGNLKDDPKLLEKAITYIKNFKESL